MAPQRQPPAADRLLISSLILNYCRFAQGETLPAAPTDGSRRIPDSRFPGSTTVPFFLDAGGDECL